VGNFKFIEHNDIDRVQWDKCIKSSLSSPLYGLCWYLDIVCPSWKAIICDDYSFVWPLPVNKKMGVSYVYQPFFTQQLGAFSNKDISADILNEAWNIIKDKYVHAHIHFNVTNPPFNASYENRRLTHWLDLNRSYEHIYRLYSTNVKRNIKKALKNKLELVISDNIDYFIKWMQRDYNERFKGIKPQHYQTLSNIYIKSRGKAQIIGIKKGANFLAQALFIKDKNQIIYLAGVNSTEGQKSGAMHLIFDEIIKENASSPLYLDFEGSMIDSIARFFKSFGSEEKYFNEWHYNIVSSTLKWFK
jgi:hypothetical protein